MIKIVMFDLDDTLLDFNLTVREAVKTGFEKFNIDGYKDAIFEEFNRINNKVWKDMPVDLSERKTILDRRWDKVFQSMGIEFDGEIFNTYFRNFIYSSAYPIKNSKEILEFLYTRYPLFICTNGPYNQQVNRLKVVDYYKYFKCIFTSEKIGHSKPRKEFFDYCLEKIIDISGDEIRPDEILLVGDSITGDISGAKEYGLKTCYFTATDNPTTGLADYIIKDLIEIKNILS